MHLGRIAPLLLTGAAALALGACGSVQGAIAPIAEPTARVTTPLEQTVYTAVDFVGRTGVLAGYDQGLNGQVVAGSYRIFRTRDGGATWRVTRLGGWRVSQIAMASSRVGYAAADEPGVASAVLRTADGGRSWQEVLELPAGASLLAAFGRSRATVMSDGRFWSTDDGGLRWHAVQPDVLGISAAAFATPDAGYAIAGASILATLDGGRHWQVAYTLPQSVTAELGPVASATADARRDGSAWASFSFGNCWPGGCPNLVLQESDGLWQIVSGEDAGPVAGLAASEDGFPGAAQALWSLSPTSAVWNGAGGLWQTSDGGQTWQELGAPKEQQPSPPFVAVSGVERGDIWAVGDDQWGGYLLHRTAHGWRQVLPQPFPVSAVDFVDQRVGYGIGLSWAPHAIVGTRDGGRTWRVLSEVTGSLPIALDFASPSVGYLATAGAHGGIWRSQDGGRTWQLEASLPAPPLSLAFRDALNGTVLLARGSGWPLRFALRETADGGSAWTTVPIPDAIRADATTATSASSPTILTSAAAAFPGRDQGYFVSLVNHLPALWQWAGAGWRETALPPGVEARGSKPEQYLGTAMSSAAGGGLWLALQPVWGGARVRILRLTTQGWQGADLPIPVRLDLPLGSEALSAYSDQGAVALTNLGPLETTDGGQTWHRP